jgi:uncharacterized protein YqeY
MSEIFDRLMADMKAAMKEHDMVAVNAIRGAPVTRGAADGRIRLDSGK